MQIKALIDVTIVTGPKSPIPELESDIETMLNYNELWNSRQHTGDVIFHVGPHRKQCWAHKQVLKSSSFWYFYDKLYDEESHDIINLYLESLEPELFEDILRFLYGYTVQSLTSSKANKLLMAAHKVIY